jgi:glycosyltransferase involved in cell wall biosynthesis
MSRATVSVVIPVLDGERYLEELLDALPSEVETLVIDSGSRDRSVAIARAGGADVIEIDDFGHGRTRNLGAERTSGELICFLTQDATPCARWLDAYLEAVALDEHVGAAYGPHLPRPDTSPMIARELEEVFAAFAPDGRAVVQRPGDSTFLSNVNACYRRACWQEIRFRDVAYSEDQAFGEDMLRAGWLKVFAPDAAVLHAHDFPTVEFMRRYFDEYRGLRASIGHVEPFGVRSTVRDVRTLVGRDLRWMTERGLSAGERARWTGRAFVHHGGRKVFSALGSRGHHLPSGVQRRLSLEGTAVRTAPPARSGGEHAGVPPLMHVEWFKDQDDYEAIARFHRDGPAPLLDPIGGMADKDPLHLAFIVPTFGIGSGGHGTIFQLVQGLEHRGHICSIWVHDPLGERRSEWPAVLRRTIVNHFSPVEAPVHKEFDDWRGADVVVATGWQTVYPALLLDGARARAYLINDHESEFYGTSVESYWAKQTYGFGLYGICAGRWLRDLYVERYGGTAGYFELGVDHSTYKPRPTARRNDTVVFYCRASTGRRAVGLGLMALSELRRRRPDLRIVMFGDRLPVPATFPYEHAGVVSPQSLSWLYSEGTVGLCLSMTNYSLIPQEMLACGLPCVELHGPSTLAAFGEDGPVSLAEFNPGAVADAIDELMSDSELWHRRSAAGLDFVAGRSWDTVTDQVEREIREALRVREGGRLEPGAVLGSVD